jgi:hypothetical protein
VEVEAGEIAGPLAAFELVAVVVVGGEVVVAGQCPIAASIVEADFLVRFASSEAAARVRASAISPSSILSTARAIVDGEMSRRDSHAP